MAEDQRTFTEQCHGILVQGSAQPLGSWSNHQAIALLISDTGVGRLVSTINRLFSGSMLNYQGVKYPIILPTDLELWLELWKCNVPIASPRKRQETTRQTAPLRPCWPTATCMIDSIQVGKGGQRKGTPDFLSYGVWRLHKKLFEFEYSFLGVVNQGKTADGRTWWWWVPCLNDVKLPYISRDIVQCLMSLGMCWTWVFHGMDHSQFKTSIFFAGNISTFKALSQLSPRFVVHIVMGDWIDGHVGHPHCCPKL